MHNDFASQARNKTLPVKAQYQSGSASRIKISKKGLPKDFFHPEVEKYLGRSKIRSKTQHTHNQFQQTSYFQTLNPPTEPKRQGRQYKSEQRKRVSKKRLNENESSTKANESFVMNCTFFKNGEQGETLSSSKQTKSTKICGKAYYHKQSANPKQLEITTNKDELSNLFKARGGAMLELSFHRLRVNGTRGPLPLIRINKRII